MEWEQTTGLLYATGDVRHIRVWDTHKEVMVQDIPTKADSSVTCLTSDSADRSLLIAGCGDGTVRLYDRRQPPHGRYADLYVCVHVCVCICLYVCMCACVHVRMYVHACMCSCLRKFLSFMCNDCLCVGVCMTVGMHECAYENMTPLPQPGEDSQGASGVDC